MTTTPASSTDAGPSTTRTGPFSPAAVLMMVLVGVFSFSAFMVLSAYAPDLRGSLDGRGHALSKSAVGYAGLVSLLGEREAPVIISRGRSDAYSDGLLVLTPELGADEKFAEMLKSYQRTLVVLPKWRTAPDLRAPGWVSQAGFLADTSVAKILPSYYGEIEVARASEEAEHRISIADKTFAFGRALSSGPIEGFQTIAGPSLEPILVDEERRIVLARVSDTEVYILSEPDLLNTHGLKDLDTAWVGVHALETLAGPGAPILMDVTLFGFERARNLLKLAFEPPFLSATLCALAAAVFMGLHAGVRFGPARRQGRAFALGKKALVDNSAALVRMTRREPRMAKGYAALTFASAIRAVGGRRGTDEAAQRALLDRLSAAGGLPRTYSELAAAANAVEDPRSLVDTARALHAWRMEMTRERR
jgi:hypothetical protein